MNDCPDLDSIMRKERRLIKIRQLLREKKCEVIKGRGIPLPQFKPLPVEVGISPENGIPVKPNPDWRLRKRGKRKKI